MTRILVVTSNHAEVVNVKVTLGKLRSLIGGGYLEAISGWHPYGEWSCYLDEEGKIKGLPLNERATMLASQAGWSGAMSDVICGPALFLGPTDDEGYDTDVPDWLVQEARSIGQVKDTTHH
jgi:hypothetical protein